MQPCSCAGHADCRVASRGTLLHSLWPGPFFNLLKASLRTRLDPAQITSHLYTCLVPSSRDVHCAFWRLDNTEREDDFV